MVWKKKEKELTKEEALKMAIEAVKPYWFSSPPLMVGVVEENRATAHPLNPKFNEQNWLIFFYDPTSYASISALEIIKKWVQRYGTLELNPIMVVQAPFKDILDPKLIRNLIVDHKLKFPIVIDHDLSLAKAFGATAVPFVTFLHQGRAAFSGPKNDFLGPFESKLQSFFRKNDPGIPFAPVFNDPQFFKKELSTINLGLRFKPQIALWHKLPGAVRKPELNWKKIPDKPIILRGRWETKEDLIYSNDPAAVIYFYSNSQCISLLGRNDPSKVDLCKVSVEVNGLPVIDSYSGKDLQMDDEGGTYLTLRDLNVYEILNGLPVNMREISLQFTNAKLTPVEIYGLRFYE